MPVHEFADSLGVGVQCLGEFILGKVVILQEDSLQDGTGMLRTPILGQGEIPLHDVFGDLFGIRLKSILNHRFFTVPESFRDLGCNLQPTLSGDYLHG